MSENIQNKNPISSTYNEVEIGKTIYCLTSKFEGEKSLDDILKRLAIKQALNPEKGE